MGWTGVVYILVSVFSIILFIVESLVELRICHKSYFDGYRVVMSIIVVGYVVCISILFLFEVKIVDVATENSSTSYESSSVGSWESYTGTTGSGSDYVEEVSGDGYIDVTIEDSWSEPSNNYTDGNADTGITYDYIDDATYDEYGSVIINNGNSNNEVYDENGFEITTSDSWNYQDQQESVTQDNENNWQLEDAGTVDIMGGY